MAKYIVAVSGGVDSVVLLYMLATGRIALPLVEETGAQRQLQGEELLLELTSKSSAEGQVPPVTFIVAHFDHGIRPESADDAEFVKNLAEKYNLPFEMTREELGANASEELARNRRYEFLRKIAKKHDAKIVTAHHADDAIETIAINLTRGTGWRGLAVLDSTDIWRPLLVMTKAEIIAYAKKKELEWRDDVTNANTKYLRNNLRQKLMTIDDTTRQALIMYWKRQLFLKHEIDSEVRSCVGASSYSRYLFIMTSDQTAIELLRGVIVNEVGVSPTRPQLVRALLAIKVFATGNRYEIGNDVSLRFTRTHFIVELIDE